MSPAVRMSTSTADEVITTLVQRLAAAGLLPAGSTFATEAFHELRSRVRARFQVPETSITPVMARLLFAIGDVTVARRILVTGSYCGNTLVWLAGRALLDGAPPGWLAVGSDVDDEACGIARSNFDRLNGACPIRIDHRDAFDVLDTEGQWDLLLLDADCPSTRKGIYLPLLSAARPRLAPRAVVLAHDTALPVFADQLAGYLAAVADRRTFAGSAHLAVDDCGLELSVLRDGPRDKEW